MSEIIADFVNPGRTILDPFMGSGTTGVAAAMSGLSQVSQVSEDREERLRCLVGKYGADSIKRTIFLIPNHTELLQTDKKIKFDWLLLPGNFERVQADLSATG